MAKAVSAWDLHFVVGHENGLRYDLVLVSSKEFTDNTYRPIKDESPSMAAETYCGRFIS